MIGFITGLLVGGFIAYRWGRSHGWNAGHERGSYIAGRNAERKRAEINWPEH